jgi:DNA polymerase III subunit delta
MAEALEIHPDRLDPVYVLYSADPLLIERAVAGVREAAVAPELRAFNYDVVEGRGATAAQIAGAARTMPMMGPRRMVYVRDLAGLPASELGELVSYIDDPSPTTVLVAVTSKLDKRVKFYAAAKKRGVLHELEPPRYVSGWIRDEARARGVRLEADAGKRLADVIGKDLARLALSIEQLGLYAGGRPVTTDDVDDLVAETRERTVFELTDAIGERNLPRAMGAVAALGEQRQSAIGVVVMLARYVRQLGLCQEGMAQRMNKGQLARHCGVPPFVVDKLQVQARRYPPQAVPVALDRLAEVDRQLKGMGELTRILGRQLGERVLLDRLVSGIIALGGGSESRTAVGR